MSDALVMPFDSLAVTTTSPSLVASVGISSTAMIVSDLSDIDELYWLYPSAETEICRVPALSLIRRCPSASVSAPRISVPFDTDTAANSTGVREDLSDTDMESCCPCIGGIMHRYNNNTDNRYMSAYNLFGIG